jgi:hypothetical protein
MYSIVLLLFSITLRASQCPFSEIRMDNVPITSVSACTKPPVISTCLHKAKTGQDKNPSSFKKVMASLYKTFSRKKPDPVFPRKLSFDTFSRKDDYEKGILKEIDPVIKTVIQKELGLSKHEMDNIVFLHDTEDKSSSNAWAHSGPNVIVFNKEMYDFAVKGSCALFKTVTLHLPTYTTNITFPPKLALRIFLATCSHEIEHLRRKHRGRNFTQEQEADAAVLAKHTRAYSVYFATKNVILCYHAPIPDKTKKWLAKHKKETAEDKLTTRDELFNIHSDRFYKDDTRNHTHPTHNERAEYFKQTSFSGSKQHDQSVEHECALVTITQAGNIIPKVIFRHMLICESFVNTITSHNED